MLEVILSTDVGRITRDYCQWILFFQDLQRGVESRRGKAHAGYRRGSVGKVRFTLRGLRVVAFGALPISNTSIFDRGVSRV